MQQRTDESTEILQHSFILFPVESIKQNMMISFTDPTWVKYFEKSPIGQSICVAVYMRMCILNHDNT